MSDEQFAYLIGGAILSVWLLAIFASAIWAHNDAQRRGQSGILIGFLVLAMWPVALVFWIALRPNRNY